MERGNIGRVNVPGIVVNPTLKTLQGSGKRIDTRCRAEKLEKLEAANNMVTPDVILQMELMYAE